ncbi:PorP/SprF family type IX secretion system membrane protein [Saccharicrinis sp. GN24d3]|uniref:PorP/SprF family type IX secretion system membrane protein n=1 Tax=Saccharicrinis sp. GN24d3 TaxID=3458416 RepID=UPI004035DC98
MRKIWVVLLIVVLAGRLCKGQDYTLNTQYILNPMSINPAYAGGNNALNLSLYYGKKWIGVEGSPQSTAFSVDAPFLHQKLGLGLMLVSDDYGVTNEKHLRTNYAFRILIPNGVLAFGLGVDVKMTKTSFQDLIALDQDDDIFLLDSKNYIVPNFSFGIHYTIKNYFIGLSIPQMLSYTFDMAKDEYLAENDFSKYSYLLNTGYKIGLNKRIKLYPSLLLQYTSMESPEKFQYDFNTLVSYDDRFWLGGSFRNERSATAILQVSATSQFSVGYGFNFEISKLNRHSNGSHEIMLRYLFKYKVDAPTPLIF